MTFTRKQIVEKIAVSVAKRNIKINRLRPIRLVALVRVMQAANFKRASVADKLIENFLNEETAEKENKKSKAGKR